MYRSRRTPSATGNRQPLSPFTLLFSPDRGRVIAKLEFTHATFEKRIDGIGSRSERTIEALPRPAVLLLIKEQLPQLLEVPRRRVFEHCRLQHPNALAPRESMHRMRHRGES